MILRHDGLQMVALLNSRQGREGGGGVAKELDQRMHEWANLAKMGR